MRKMYVLGIVMVFMCLGGASYAQSFKEVSKTKLPFEPSKICYEHTSDFGFFLCSSKTDMAMIDGNKGQVLWQLNFPKEFGLKTVGNQLWNKNANVILLFGDDSKKGISTKYFIDGKNGKVLWKSDKYVSDFGAYTLFDGFERDFDPVTNGVLLPTKEAVDFVNVSNGTVLWSKSFDLTGKAKEFDCFVMNYYDLIKIITGKESAIYLTARDGKEVTDISPYYNQKKALADTKHTKILNIPDKNMYVVLHGETGTLFALLGADLPSWKMNFTAYKEGTNERLWSKDYNIAYGFDCIRNTPYIKMLYLDGKIFVEHMPNLKSNSGLTVIDADCGDKIWECYYTTTEMKGLTSVTWTPFPAPDPVVLNGNAYVVDKVKNKVYCLDANTGKVKWESEKFEDAQKIPTLVAVDWLVIMGYGGSAKKIQKTEATSSGFCMSYHTPSRVVTCSGGKQQTYKYVFNSNDKYGINAYDANTGKIVWTHENLAKSAKDKFSYIAGMLFVDNKLYCATDKNFFILNPKTGEVVNSCNVNGQKLGDVWGMAYYPDKNTVVLNAENGIIKIDVNSVKIVGTVKSANVQGPAVADLIGGDDDYTDYAIFTDGNVEKMEYKEFAAINLDNMSIRGADDASIIFADVDHFSEGAEKFFKSDGKFLTVYTVK